MTENPSWLGFAELCEILAATRGKLAKRAAIAAYLRPLDAAAAGLAAQYLTGSVFPENEELAVNVGGRLVVRALEAIVHATPETFHATYRKHGDLGATAEELLRTVPRESEGGLGLHEVAERLNALAAARQQAVKFAQLVDTLRSFSPRGAKYFTKLLLGDMRTGVQQSLVEEAIAAAAEEPLSAVRHAGMLLGSLPAVVELSWRHKLETASFRMFHSLGFMLATPAANAQEAYAKLSQAKEIQKDTTQPSAAIPADNDFSAQVEDKYDGMRAQIHCGDPSQPGRVRIFSRTRDDITTSFPEIVEWFAGATEPAILDGEVLAWDFTAARALPFTSLQPRLGRKRVTSAMQAASPVIFMAFDMLLRSNELLLNLPLRVRRSHLEAWAESVQHTSVSTAPVGAKDESQISLFATEGVTEGRERPTRLKLSPVTSMLSAQQLDAAFSAARARGNEGLMVKSVASAYQPGRRGAAWLKIKRELATLDVVVTAVEYGHGRRAAVLSDYTFAVRSGEDLLNVGKAYSGLTDDEIATLTPWFQQHTLEESGGQLLVEPKIILEVAFNNVMLSDRHSSGYALRFPRIVRIRSDKPLEEIDTLERVAEIYETQHTKG
ncbi:MAG TPA: ATP-dependent DNA ligase [Acidobacteriaceae bacterium]|nr:ATP-dependent DNA ligase [Acidobacteriaceae bacterium]